MTGETYKSAMLTPLMDQEFCSFSFKKCDELPDEGERVRKAISLTLEENIKLKEKVEEKVAQRETELIRHNERREMLHTILKILQQNIPFEEQLNNILNALFSNTWLQVLRKGAIFTVEKDSGELSLAVQHGLHDEQLALCSRIPFGKCLCGQAADTGEIVFSDSLDERHEIAYDGIEPHGHYCIPIKSEKAVLGVLSLYVKEGAGRERYEEEFLVAVANALATLIERKRAVEALIESEGKYRRLVEFSPEPIGVHSKGKWIYVNPASIRLFGGSEAEDILGKSILDFVHPDYRGIVKERVRNESEEGQLAPLIEEKLLKLDGTAIWAEVTAIPITYEEKPASLVLARDITDRKKAEAELRNLAKVFTESATPTVIEDVNGIICEANDAAVSVYGWSREELIGESIKKLVPDYKKEEQADNLHERCRNGELVRDVEGVRIHKDGTHIPIMLTLSLLTDDNNNPTGIVTHATDITEKKQAEESLKNSEDKFRRIINNLQDTYFQTDAEGIIQVFSPSVQDLSGYTPAEVIGTKIADYYIDQDGRSKFLKALEATGQGRIFGYEEEVLHKDGHHLWVSTNAQFLHDEQGQVIGIEGTIRSITERKRAEKALLNSKKRLRAVLDTVGEGTIAIDSSGAIVMVNKEVQNIWGYEQEELIDKSILILMPEKYREAHIAGLKRYIESGVPTVLGQRMEYEGLKKNGETFPLEICITETKISEGLFFTAAVRDITDRKIAEKEKERLHAQLLQSQKIEAIGTLAGGVAHDFNNILTAIIGNTELVLQKVNEADPLRQRLIHVKEAGNRAADLTRQLLLYSRKQSLMFTTFNLNNTIDHLLKMVHRLIGENITIETKLSPDLWSIRADEGNTEQVIMNLTVNGRDAMPEGGKLTISTENRVIDDEYCKSNPYATPGSFIRMTISDTGVGMEEATMKRIFEPFFTTKGLAKGTGLGMSVVYGIVRKHKGWINVESTVGEGTTFDVYLPASPEKFEETAEEEVLLEEYRGNGERILLVEDEEVVCDFGSTVLEENGYRVVTAASVEEALAIFEREQGNFDLIFSDVVLADQNGLTLVNELIALKPDLKVLMSSGYTDDKSKWPAIEERDYPFLQKPYKIADLLKTVSSIIR